MQQLTSTEWIMYGALLAVVIMFGLWIGELVERKGLRKLLRESGNQCTCYFTKIQEMEAQIADMRVTGSNLKRELLDTADALAGISKKFSELEDQYGRACKRHVETAKDLVAANKTISEQGIAHNEHIRRLADDLQEADAMITVLKAIVKKKSKVCSFFINDRVRLEKYINTLNDIDVRSRRARENERRRKAHAAKKGGWKSIGDPQPSEPPVTMRPRKRGKGLEAVLPGANSVNGKEGRV